MPCDVTTADLSSCSFHTPNAQSPSGHFDTAGANSSSKKAGQFGTVDWLDGAGPVHMHNAFITRVGMQQGATLNSAVLTVTNDQGAAQVNTTGLACVEATDDAVAPIGAADALARLLAAPSVAFTMNGGPGATTRIDLTSLFNALAQRPGWVNFNRVQIHLRADNGNAGSTNPLMVQFEAAPMLQVVAATNEPTLSFAAQMVAKLEAALLSNPTAGAISVDGTSTTFIDVQKRLAFFYRQMSLESGQRKTFSGIPLGGFSP